MSRWVHPLRLAGVGRQHHGGACGLRHRPAFSLIELLTVVAIIAILISILVPSLNRARIVAKRTATSALLHSIKSGAEMFREATDEYPDSSAGSYYGDSSQGVLYGAQKIARALMGREALVTKLGSVPPKLMRESSNPSEFYGNNINPAQRIGPFVENVQPDRQYAATASASLPYHDRPGSLASRGGSDSVADSPIMFIDSFQYPVLYWRANPKGTLLATATASGAGEGGRRASSGAGYYVHEDNLGFLDWQFLSRPHPMRTFGDPIDPDSGDAGTFSNVIHIHSEEGENAPAALKRLRKPYNADSFLLITPGQDGLYGTPDDIRNFGD